MKIVHNSDYYKHTEQYDVKCLKHKKDATITVFYDHKKLCKTDIQLTPVEVGWKCSICEENNTFRCIECPYRQK